MRLNNPSQRSRGQEKIKKNEKQAGAELGQAQLKLGFNFTIVFF